MGGRGKGRREEMDDEEKEEEEDEQARRHRYMTFPQLMGLEPLASSAHSFEVPVGEEGAAMKALRFRSRERPFAPGGGTASYGGHVFAQAAWAAAATVGEGFVLHHISGSFVMPGKPYRTFVYAVRTIRNGASYVTRAVDATQPPTSASSSPIVFTAIISFKRPSVPNKALNEVLPSHQPSPSPYQRFRAILSQKQSPAKWPEDPSVDSPWYWHSIAENDGRDPWPCPGVETRKVDMGAFNDAAGREPLERRQLRFYAAVVPPPAPAGDGGGIAREEVMPDPASSTLALNLHVCAHLYASDRNSLFAIPNFLGFGDGYSRMGTLGLTVVVHSGVAEELGLTRTGEGVEEGVGAKNNRRWFCQENWVERVADGRGLHVSRMWDEDGRHVATSYQDGLVSLWREAEEEEEEAGDIKGKL